MTFTPGLVVTASTAIWQSHQGRFTCLTFTCLHAVNTTFSLFCGGALRRGGEEGSVREGRRFSWETSPVFFFKKKKDQHQSHSGEAPSVQLREIHNLFPK